MTHFAVNTWRPLGRTIARRWATSNACHHTVSFCFYVKFAGSFGRRIALLHASCEHACMHAFDSLLDNSWLHASREISFNDPHELFTCLSYASYNLACLLPKGHMQHPNPKLRKRREHLYLELAWFTCVEQHKAGNLACEPSRSYSLCRGIRCLCVAARCMLEACGLIVRSIPFYEWNSLDGLEQQKAYLSRLLGSVAAQLPARS